jgi:hypothetical protein
LPRESRISRAPTASMEGTGVSLAVQDGFAASLPRRAAGRSAHGAGPLPLQPHDRADHRNKHVSPA